MIFALNAGQLVVAQTAILGSILVNALLVLGLVIIAGALRTPDGIMRFSPRLPNDTATLLLVASFIIAAGRAGRLGPRRRQPPHQDDLDHQRDRDPGRLRRLAVDQYLTTQAAGSWPEPRRPRLPIAVSLAILVAAGDRRPRSSRTGSSTRWTPTIHTLHISKAFAGLVIVAIAGNAVEHVVGVVLAAKGQAELAIAVVKNSVAQIAAFLFPLLVLVSLLTTTTLTFALAPVYIGALIGTAVIVWQITGDGEATLFEGAALVAAFVILATVAAFE